MQQRAITEVNLLYDAWLQCLASQAKFVGISVAVMAGPEHTYIRALGNLLPGDDKPLEPHHLFCIGSQTKPLTAAIIMRLVERGKIDLYEHAAKYLPWLKNHPDPIAMYITVQQLMRHTSGLARDGADAGYWALRDPFPSAESLQQQVIASSFLYKPATVTKYSNLGYALLGQVIEAASGMEYGAAAQELLINPIRLRNSFPNIDLVGDVSAIADGNARYFKGQRAAYVQNVATHSFSSATGWYSTPTDLTTTFRALHTDDTLLSKRSRAMLLYGEKRYFEPSRRQYGAGLMRLELECGTTLFGHAGAYFGHHSCTIYDPTTDVTISVAVNCPDTNPTTIALGIREIQLSYCHNNSWTASDRFNGIFASPGSRRYIGAFGENYASYNLQEIRPLLTRDLLTEHSINTLRVKESSYIGYQGEDVQYDFNRDNAPKQILYGGVPARAIGKEQI